jgi:hypothetical protein
MTLIYFCVQIKTGAIAKQLNPSEHKTTVCTYHEADAALIKKVM